MKLIDYHIHCNYSPDNKNEIRDVIKHISENNFFDACIVAHFEPSRFGKPGIFKEPNSIKPEQFDEYFKKVEKSNKEFGQNVKIGLEVEYHEEFEKVIGKYLKEYNFDFILGSCHWIRDVIIASIPEDGAPLFKKYKPKEVSEFYFEKLKNAINSKLFDSMAHMDIIKKSATPNYGSFPEGLYEKFMPEVASLLIKNKVCFEVNTNPHAMPDKKSFYPSINIIKRLYSEGVRNVTIGSDTHEIRRIGDRMEEVINILAGIGFKNICTFNRRVIKPIAISKLSE